MSTEFFSRLFPLSISVFTVWPHEKSCVVDFLSGQYRYRNGLYCVSGFKHENLIKILHLKTNITKSGH